MTVHPLLSVLIPTLPERAQLFRALYGRLQVQAEGQPVELLALLDNKVMSVGRKRQALLDMAIGDYIVFIDDDDTVVDDYVQEILLAIRQNPGVDVIIHPIEFRRSYRDPWSLSYYYLKETYQTARDLPGGDYIGPPPHTVPWRRELVKDCKFPEKNFGEDSAWVTQARNKARTWVDIPRPLYRYCFDERVTATR